MNQALVFYHFGSVDELLSAACRHGAEQRVDADGAARALDALDQLSALVGVLEELGPVAQRAVRARLRRSSQAGR
ncbi:hypothetical protein GCM10010191_56340 [Actinomadura vinacea]|uniref:TetR family transcriptional regulator n=1 Tax=Actinomadura vinacea TaxID=115336 RepID=A0ABN3JMA8_9ACTN